MDDTKKALEKGNGGPTEAGAGNVDDVAASRAILSEADSEDTSDDGAWK